MAFKSLEELKLKLIAVGDSGVGKSSIITRFCDDSFAMDFVSTIGIDFKIRSVTVDGEPVRIQIWDTAGQERFRTITTAFYRGAHAAFVVYDVNNMDSYESMQYWIDMCRRNCMLNTPIIVVGNKTDIEGTEEAIESGRQVAEANQLIFLPTSAKNGNNVKELFERLVRLIRAKQKEDDAAQQASQDVAFKNDDRTAKEKNSDCKCQ